MSGDCRKSGGAVDYWRLGKTGIGKKDMKDMKTMKFMKGAGTRAPPSCASLPIQPPHPLLAAPMAHWRTIRARTAKAWAVVGRREYCSSAVRSDGLSYDSGTGHSVASGDLQLVHHVRTSSLYCLVFF